MCTTSVKVYETKDLILNQIEALNYDINMQKEELNEFKKFKNEANDNLQDLRIDLERLNQADFKKDLNNQLILLKKENEDQEKYFKLNLERFINENSITNNRLNEISKQNEVQELFLKSLKYEAKDLKLNLERLNEEDKNTNNKLKEISRHNEGQEKFLKIKFRTIR